MTQKIAIGLYDGITFKTDTVEEAQRLVSALVAGREARAELATARLAFDAMVEIQQKTAETARKALDERDAALAKAADSDARLVRALDAAKVAALAALNAPEGFGLTPSTSTDRLSGLRVDALDLVPTCDDTDCPFCDDGLDADDGLDVARKGRATPDVRR